LNRIREVIAVVAVISVVSTTFFAFSVSVKADKVDLVGGATTSADNLDAVTSASKTDKENTAEGEIDAEMSEEDIIATALEREIDKEVIIVSNEFGVTTDLIAGNVLIDFENLDGFSDIQITKPFNIAMCTDDSKETTLMWIVNSESTHSKLTYTTQKCIGYTLHQYTVPLKNGYELAFKIGETDGKVDTISSDAALEMLKKSIKQIRVIERDTHE